jgi:type II secretory pathway pseudopilin PulG
MIVVAIIGLLAAIAIPNFVKARTTSQQNACINNLRLIDAAKQQWALEQRKQSTDTPVPNSWLGPAALPGPRRQRRIALLPGGSAERVSPPATPNNVGASPVCNIVSSTHILP